MASLLEAHSSAGSRWPGAAPSSRPGWAAHLPPTADQLEEISAVFAAMKPEDGAVDYYTAKAALRGMGFAVRKRELQQLLAQCCPHVADDGRLSQDDFAALVLRYAARRSPQEQLAHDFALLDSSGKGWIDAGDLKMVAKTLPPETRVTDADIACMCVPAPCAVRSHPPRTGRCC